MDIQIFCTLLTLFAGGVAALSLKHYEIYKYVAPIIMLILGVCTIWIVGYAYGYNNALIKINADISTGIPISKDLLKIDFSEHAINVLWLIGTIFYLVIMLIIGKKHFEKITMTKHNKWDELY